MLPEELVNDGQTIAKVLEDMQKEAEGIVAAITKLKELLGGAESCREEFRGNS